MTQVTVETAVQSSFRVQQVAGMFDLPQTKTLRETFRAELPSLDESWRIGAIVGPSGSGKSTLARAAYAQHFYAPRAWQRDAAIVDGFGELPIETITRTLTAVGFGSPPSWLKPFHVLSTGEQFRCELARALLDAGDAQPNACVVFDEFTSVVDRTVAQIASAAITRSIHAGHLATRFVAVSCHRDILPWLEADWVFDTATGKLTRGRLRRPCIELDLRLARHAAWPAFARHHYLSGSLSRAATVYLATWRGQPVALCAVVAMYGHAGRRRIHRLVTLPDFQGVGVGSRLLDATAAVQRDAGRRVNITSSHPAVIAHCRRSDAWRAVQLRRTGGGRQAKDGAAIRDSRGRATVSFEFIGGANPLQSRKPT
ncbi:MAG: hypothetical protein KDA41_09285 [Planctomycetales bacterium]|nr:hypothetical protein [Planctomycetales bacterium]